MTQRAWVLTDVENNVFRLPFLVTPGDVWGAPPGFNLERKTLRGGLRDGLDVIELDNGNLKIWLLPDRGMGIWKIWQQAREVGWKSPVKGPVHPRLVPLDEAHGIGWLRGFDELLCRCGMDSNGAPEWDANGRLLHPLHGRIANLPAHYLEAAIDGAEIRVRGQVEEARLFGSKLRLTSTLSTRVGEASLRIHDRVTNLSSMPADLEWLYHINFGPPLATPSARIWLPARCVAPRDPASRAELSHWPDYGPERTTGTESVLYFELAANERGWTESLLEAADHQWGVRLTYNARQMPWFILWKSPQPGPDGYVTGLEPAINFPNVKSFEQRQGRVARLEPGESRDFELELEVLSTCQQVEQAVRRIQSLVQDSPCRVFDNPRPEWSPGANA